jgi:glycosyltransferase involved in cell wall biosynthesis
MACGLPLLIADSRYSAARFFVKDNGYLFNSHHAKDLADKIYMLKMNPKIMENMKEKSVEYAASFSFETSIKKMSEFFISFCKKQ